MTPSARLEKHLGISRQLPLLSLQGTSLDIHSSPVAGWTKERPTPSPVSGSGHDNQLHLQGKWVSVTRLRAIFTHNSSSARGMRVKRERRGLRDFRPKRGRPNFAAISPDAHVNGDPPQI